MRSKGSYFNFGGLGVDVFLLEAALPLATVPNCSQFAVRTIWPDRWRFLRSLSLLEV